MHGNGLILVLWSRHRRNKLQTSQHHQSSLVAVWSEKHCLVPQRGGKASRPTNDLSLVLSPVQQCTTAEPFHHSQPWAAICLLLQPLGLLSQRGLLPINSHFASGIIWTDFYPCRTIPPLPVMLPLLFLQCFQKCTWAIQLPHPLVREAGVQRSIDWDLFLPKLVHLDAGSQPVLLWGGKGARQEGKIGEIRSRRACSERIRGRLLQARSLSLGAGVMHSWWTAFPFSFVCSSFPGQFWGTGHLVKRKRCIRGKKEQGASTGLAATNECVAWDSS